MDDTEIRKMSPVALLAELRQFEDKYGLSSEEFYERFNRGEMGDSADVVEWAGLYEWSVREAKRQVEA